MLEAKVKKLKNELIAQKQFSPLSWGQLAKPEETPTVIITDTIDITTPLSLMYVAKYVAKFTRTDGQAIAPLVDFAYDYTISPTGIKTEEDGGATVTATSIESLFEGTENHISAATAEDGSVEFTILFLTSEYLGLTQMFNTIFGTQNVDLTLTVQAISPVPGELTVERSYSV